MFRLAEEKFREASPSKVLAVNAAHEARMAAANEQFEEAEEFASIAERAFRRAGDTSNAKKATLRRVEYAEAKSAEFEPLPDEASAKSPAEKASLADTIWKLSESRKGIAKRNARGRAST